MYNVICIPAYKPDQRLVTLVESLEECGLTRIVVTDDGGGQEFTPIFTRVGELGCTVVRHEHNLGKGAAIRTGIEKAIHTFGRDINIVTADADGQHLPQDIVRIVDTLDSYPDHLVLGVRNFDKENVPTKSRRSPPPFSRRAPGSAAVTPRQDFAASPHRFSRSRSASRATATITR